jgi:catechol 2,3-dioxygenase-like lactoylglutathione lyase family enzyme
LTEKLAAGTQGTTTGASRLTGAPSVATITTTDLARSRDFWIGTLGFKETRYDEESGYLVAEAGKGSTFMCYVRSEPPKSEGTSITFPVQDIERVVKDLRGRGVTFETYDMPELGQEKDGIYGQDDMRAAWFTDPDGNIVAVIQTPEE